MRDTITRAGTIVGALLLGLWLMPSAALAAQETGDEGTTSASTPPGLVISEIAPTGPFGGSFVTVTNWGQSPVNLDGVRISVCTSSGIEFLVSTLGDPPLAPFESYTVETSDIPEDGGVRLSDPNGSHVDGIGWSANPCTETLPAVPCDGWSLGETQKRIPLTDTDNNLVDFPKPLCAA